MELKLQIQEVLGQYSTLNYDEANNSLEGELFVSKGDSYDVSILLSSYPKLFPQVFEIGERIPRKVTRHIYSDTGSCCLSTSAKSQILLKTTISNLTLFVKEIVIPYFQNNSYFELKGKYKTEEYSHDSMGIIEGYRDILQTNNDLNIARLMLQRIERDKLRIHNQCYCGSGQSLKKCNGGKHYYAYKDFRKIDIDLLKNDLNILAKVLRNRGIIE